MSTLSIKLIVAVLATNGVEQSELEEPRKALERVGVKTMLVSLQSGEIKTWNGDVYGDSVPVDLTLDQADPTTFTGLLLPGGVMNPDKLRNNSQAVNFVRQFFLTDKPVAAICHGPQILIDAEVVMGRTLTSFSSIKMDLINAGAIWVDQPVVVDRGLITSRQPSDIPAFNEQIIRIFQQTTTNSRVSQSLLETYA